MNDAVGALAGARYWDADVMVAVILGTGTNASYVERVDAIPKLHTPNSAGGTTVCTRFHFQFDFNRFEGVYKLNHDQIINTEWGAFSRGLPLTEFDREMDAASINPGKQVAFFIPHFSFVLLCAFHYSLF